MVMEYETMAVWSRGGRIVSRRIALVMAWSLCASASSAQERRMLRDGWLLESSAKVGTDGAAISSSSYHPHDWYAATAPSTVVGALVTDGVYKDPFFGMNLRTMPGMTYAIGANFVHTAMDPS